MSGLLLSGVSWTRDPQIEVLCFTGKKRRNEKHRANLTHAHCQNYILASASTWILSVPLSGCVYCFRDLKGSAIGLSFHWLLRFYQFGFGPFCVEFTCSPWLLSVGLLSESCGSLLPQSRDMHVSLTGNSKIVCRCERADLTVNWFYPANTL